jgi:hypothetical protein
MAKELKKLLNEIEADELAPGMFLRDPGHFLGYHTFIVQKRTDAHSLKYGKWSSFDYDPYTGEVMELFDTDTDQAKKSQIIKVGSQLKSKIKSSVQHELKGSTFDSRQKKTLKLALKLL